MRMKMFVVAVAACVVAGGSTTAFAQAYPTRPIHVIVPLTPGSGADVAGRIVAKYMGMGLGQPLVVENRPGAGGQIGTMAVVKSPPDGYTIMVQSASHTSNPAIYKTLPYDSLKDLIDVAILGMTPYVMVTSATGPYRSVKALVDAAKAKPETIPFASAGMGGAAHLTAEYFLQMAGIKMMHIPYKGSPEAIRDAAAGRVAFYMAPINTAIGLIKDGKVAALGVSSSHRAAVLPDVPTIAEQGIAGFSMTLWFGMWTPAGTPPAVVSKLNSEVARVMKLPELGDNTPHSASIQSPCRPRSSPSLSATISRSTSASSSRAIFRSNNLGRESGCQRSSFWPRATSRRFLLRRGASHRYHDL